MEGWEGFKIYHISHFMVTRPWIEQLGCIWIIGLGHHESDLGAVKDERRPAAWAGKISPKEDMAAADLSLKMPTCPSVSMDPSLKVLSPNLLPT